MGNWNITIQGSGAHHNIASPIDYDANKMAAEFVEKLRAYGHTVTSATFTHGGCDDVTKGGEYLEACKRTEEAVRKRAAGT